MLKGTREILMYILEEVDPLSAAVYNQLLVQPQQMPMFLHNEGRVVTTHQLGAREAQKKRFNIDGYVRCRHVLCDEPHLLILTQSGGTIEDMLFFTSMRN